MLTLAMALGIFFLYDDIMDFNNPENRAKQWAFRNHVNMEGIIHNIKYTPKHATPHHNPEIEFSVGEFEHGGDLIARHYFDKKGKPALKSHAVGYFYKEFKNNQEIHSGKVYFNK